MIELASALTLPIAKLLLKSWLGESVAADVGDNLLKLGFTRFGDWTKARAAQQRANGLADALVRDLGEFFSKERVDEDALLPAAFELGETIRSHVDAAFLVTQSLSPEAIAEALLAARPLDKIYPRADPVSGLYVRLVEALAPRLRALAPRVPGYELERDAILLQMAKVADGVDARLAAIEPVVQETARGVGELVDRPKRQAAGYEARYLRAVATELNRVEIIGLTVDEPARGGELEVAYLSLHAHLGVGGEVRRIDFASLLTLLPALGGRVLVEGPAGAGKSTLLRWAAIQAARWRLGDAPRTDPLAIAPDLDGWLPLFVTAKASDCPILSPRARPFGAEAEAPGGRNYPLMRLRNELNEASWLTRLPFFIPLRKTGRKLDLAALPKLACTTVGNPPEQWMDELAPSALLLFDAVDEVQAGAERQAVLDVIEDWSTCFSDAQIVVTARPGAVSEHALPGFRRIRLDELDDAQKAEFIEHWHRALASQLGWRPEDPVISRLCIGARRELEHQRALNDLAANPLLCASIAALHWDRRREAAKAARRANASLDIIAAVLPGTRWELFSDLTKMLLHRREQESPDFDTRSYPAAYQLDFEQKRAALARIAFGMVENDMRSTMRRRDAERRIEQALADMRASIDAPSGAILDALVERSGVLRAAGEDEVEFIHNTLRAFLAAQRYLALGEPTTVARKLADADVEELASGLDEVAVFCSANPHAQRFAADLMRALLDRGETLARRAEGESRARALRILAMRCEAAAGTDLPGESRRPIREMAPGLFPPQTMEEARDLAALEDDAIPLLTPAADVAEEHAAACVRCLRLIGTEMAREAMCAYLATESLVVAEELVQDHNPLRITAVLTAAQDSMAWSKVPPTIKSAIRDLTPLANLTDLQELDLSGTQVVDAAPLANLTNLETLDLSGTQVADAAPLAKLTNLQWLYLSGTQVADAAPLANLTNLPRL
jgi:NACHT domain